VIAIKRAYEKAAATDGARYLVDRLWPRGVKKDAMRLTGWLKDVAPSDKLRRWFGHDPKNWEEFQRRYAAELDANPDAWRPLVDAARRGKVTLVYGARDTKHCNAVVLRHYLDARLNHD
jgi:uncharacterized protein YeaO (DUF488 family)